MIKWCLPFIIVVFAGSSSSKYTTEILHFWRIVATDACDKELRMAVLANGLVNYSKKRGYFFKVDYMNELLNNELKTNIRAHVNSSYTIEELFNTILPTLGYMHNVRNILKAVYSYT